MYTIRAQRFEIVGTKADRKVIPDSSYLMYECPDMVSYTKTLVAIANTHGRGYKYRLMDATEDSARFDVQLTA